MSRPINVTAGGSITAFHDIAALRGDGLHPKLLEALAKTGTVSGPRAENTTSDRNIIPVDFASRSSLPAPDRKASK
ncbi:hypothetical protein [Roseibium album]|uniref:hypothetical protein n=1 Tax=Roseibium album TaxID=311410 RepID=UPI0024904B46|nr:hypothetical protein [Roseibium album]